MPGIDGIMGSGLGNGSGTGGNGSGAGSDIPIAPPDPLITQLSNLVFKLPCGDDGSCPLNDNSNFIVHIPDDDQVHTCNMLVRGVVELNTYIGAIDLKTFLSKGGSPPTGDYYNIYQLSIDDPPQTYNLNSADSLGQGVCVIDYFMRIKVKNGSKVTLHADSIDYREAPNSNNLSVPDHTEGHPISVKQPYAGEFIQVDAISIEQEE
jgi:hypothetical protein